LVVEIERAQLAENFAALLRFKSDDKACVALEQQLLSPSPVLVGPGLDRKQVTAGRWRRESAVPAIIAVERHRLAAPIGLGFSPPQQLRGELVVALTQQIRPHLDGLSGNALDRVAAAVDAWIDVLDQKPRSGRITGGDLWMLRNRKSS